MQAAKKTSKELDVATYRTAVDHAVAIRGFVEYHDAYAYARGIEDAIDSIEGLLKDGPAAAVIDLTEYALEAVEHALGSVDDSDGHLGDILRRLQDIHLDACNRTDWDTFFGAADTSSHSKRRCASASESGFASLPSRSETCHFRAPTSRLPKRTATRASTMPLSNGRSVA